MCNFLVSFLMPKNSDFCRESGAARIDIGKNLLYQPKFVEFSIFADIIFTYNGYRIVNVFIFSDLKQKSNSFVFFFCLSNDGECIPLINISYFYIAYIEKL